MASPVWPARATGRRRSVTGHRKAPWQASWHHYDGTRRGRAAGPTGTRGVLGRAGHRPADARAAQARRPCGSAPRRVPARGADLHEEPVSTTGPATSRAPPDPAATPVALVHLHRRGRGHHRRLAGEPQRLRHRTGHRPIGAAVHHRAGRPQPSRPPPGAAHRRRDRPGHRALLPLSTSCRATPSLEPLESVVGPFPPSQLIAQGNLEMSQAEAAAKTAALRKLGYPVSVGWRPGP